MADLVLTTDDGVHLAARRYQAAGERRSVVVVSHGFAASKDDPAVAALVAALTGAGHEVIVYDARGHHASGGRCTLGAAEWRDVAAATAAARRVDARIVTVGASMGAIAALRHGVHDPDLGGIVTVSSPASWQMPRNLRVAAAALLTRTRLGRRVAARRLGVRIHPVWSNPPPPVDAARRLRVPLAVVHGAADRMISPRAAEELAAGAGAATRLDIVGGMGHAFDPIGIPAILTAIDWILGLGRVPSPAHA